MSISLVSAAAARLRRLWLPVAIGVATVLAPAWAPPPQARTHEAGRVDVPGMVRKVLPAVVSITTRQIERDQFNQPVPTRGLGSGVIVDGRGYTPQVAYANDLPMERGALVIRVDPDGPAAAAGVQPGDVITAVDGRAVRDLHHFHESLARYRAGQTVSVALARDGQTLMLRLLLEEDR